MLDQETTLMSQASTVSDHLIRALRCVTQVLEPKSVVFVSLEWLSMEVSLNAQKGCSRGNSTDMLVSPQPPDLVTRIRLVR